MLTYARSRAEAEDITLFDRLRHRNIAVYSSEETLARRGPSYSDDDLRDYDVIDYNIDLAVSPGRQWIDGVASVLIRVRAADADDGVAAAGRLAGGAVDHQRSLRPAVRISRQPPERGRHQPAGDADARHADDADVRLCRAASRRSRPDGSEAVGVGRVSGQDQTFEPRRSSPPSRASSTATASRGIRRPPPPTTRRRR